MAGTGYRMPLTVAYLIVRKFAPQEGQSKHGMVGCVYRRFTIMRLSRLRSGAPFTHHQANTSGRTSQGAGDFYLPLRATLTPLTSVCLRPAVRRFNQLATVLLELLANNHPLFFAQTLTLGDVALGSTLDPFCHLRQ